MGAQYYEGSATTETVPATVPSSAYVDTSPSLANWGAIVAGVFAGFALLVLLNGLGAAIGVRDTAAALLAQWTLGGLFAGWVIGKCARTRRLFLPGISSIVGWGLGMAIFLGFLATGAGTTAYYAAPNEEMIRIGGRIVTAGWIHFAGMILSLGGMYAGSRIGCREEALVVR